MSRTSAMCSSSAAFCCMLLMPSSIAAGLWAQHRQVKGGPGAPAAPPPRGRAAPAGSSAGRLPPGPGGCRACRRGWRKGEGAAAASPRRFVSPERDRSLFPSAGSDLPPPPPPPSTTPPSPGVIVSQAGGETHGCSRRSRSRARRGSSVPPRLSHGRVGAAWPRGRGPAPRRLPFPEGRSAAPPAPGAGRRRPRTEERSAPLPGKVPAASLQRGAEGRSALGRSRSGCGGCGVVGAGLPGLVGCCCHPLRWCALRLGTHP